MPMNQRLMRPRASGFDPRSIANLTGWFDASDSTSYTESSGQISEWRDKSGTGNSISQATAGNRPTLFESSGDTQNATRSTIGSKQAIFFDGVNDRLATTNTVTSSQSRTVIAVARRTANGAGDTTLANFGPTTESAAAKWACRYGGTSARAVGGDTVATNQTISSVLTEWLSNHVVCWSQTSSNRNLSYFVNGTSYTVSGNPPNAQTSFAGLTVGMLVGGSGFGAVQFMNGHIGEFLIYDRELSAAERQRVEGYLAWKWGLQAQLPYNHPYAASFPGFGSQTIPTDSDALTYLAAVATADGGTGVEVGVANAVDSFIKGCKADGIWSAIKASCILSGARTLSGALVPLVGTAPTNGGPFVSGDYNRKTGLGNGSGKRIDTNRANNADPQNDCHAYVRITQGPGNGATNVVFGTQWNATGERVMTWFDQFQAASNYTENAGANKDSSIGFETAPSAKVPGGWGVSRSASNAWEWMNGNGPYSRTSISMAPKSDNIAIFGSFGSLGIANAARMSFYSVGTNLSLATLNSRVGTLMTAIGNAIP